MRHTDSRNNIRFSTLLGNYVRTGLAAFAICLCVPGSSKAEDREDKSAPPLLALLSPPAGAALNAPALHVQALVAAFKSQKHRTFVFNGQTIVGSNKGHVNRVEVAVDGLTLESLDTRKDGSQIVADFQVALAGVASGTHNLTVTAFQGEDDEEGVPAVQSATFTLDRTLVATEVNPIEQAANPQPFAAFSVGSAHNENDGDGEQDNDEDGQGPSRLGLSGKFVLGNLSDGVDFAKDRLVVALGSHVTLLEPGQLICKSDERERSCRFEDGSQSLLRSVSLKQDEGGLWRFSLRTRGSTLPADVRALYLRIGNDWGGVDLTTGERLVSLRPALDMSHRAQSSIGANGGTMEAIDGAGVRISLQIPPGALTRDTLIKLTPLSSSPLAESSRTLHPGVQFERVWFSR